MSVCPRICPSNRTGPAHRAGNQEARHGRGQGEGGGEGGGEGFLPARERRRREPASGGRDIKSDDGEEAEVFLAGFHEGRSLQNHIKKTIQLFRIFSHF